jgi:protein-disulfide isomerase
MFLAFVAVVGIGWIGYSVTNRGGAAATEPIQLTGIEDAQALLAQATGISSGAPDGAVQVLVFSDYTCPACRAFTGVIEPQLKAEFVSTNRIRFTYYDYPLGGDAHRHGFIAARAARCAADQSRFWEYHDVLFARQQEWAYAAGTPLDEFVDYAGILNLDRNAFSACLRSDAHADVVTANRVLGDRLGVAGTPTVFIGGRSVPNWQDYEAIKAALEYEIGPTTGQ